ncbi:MAG: hypothetical protein J5738_08220 [Lachnospiraceae bacterium]|nr:hypothetical protein [Lachnospiraceae bacterium]MBO4668534.1 hypothetical protein [Lachnospiraceae bacterium]MBR5666795.1 hypothetical protein [Lachnospiraceae bacterium]
MAFIWELLRSIGVYIGLVCCAGVGIFCGISLRKRKNRKKEAKNAENA